MIEKRKTLFRKIIKEYTVENSKELKGTYGLYPWFAEHGYDLIKSEDVEAFIRLSPFGKVFECIEKNEEFITLKYAENTYSVKALIYKKVENPLFIYGTEVIIKNSNQVAIIRDIHWHYKSNEPIYYIEINGKRKSKRYFEHELTLVSGQW